MTFKEGAGFFYTHTIEMGTGTAGERTLEREYETWCDDLGMGSHFARWDENLGQGRCLRRDRGLDVKVTTGINNDQGQQRDKFKN
jgi:hypothetical protein